VFTEPLSSNDRWVHRHTARWSHKPTFSSPTSLAFQRTIWRYTEVFKGRWPSTETVTQTECKLMHFLFTFQFQMPKATWPSDSAQIHHYGTCRSVKLLMALARTVILRFSLFEIYSQYLCSRLDMCSQVGIIFRRGEGSDLLYRRNHRQLFPPTEFHGNVEASRPKIKFSTKQIGNFILYL
jgi:hypothetical protein